MGQKKGRIFVVASPSGCGKTTIVNHVLQQYSQELDLHMVATYTTRQRRDHEIHGKDYCFVSKEEFLEKEQAGFFLETNEFNSNLYGSPASIIEETKHGKSFIYVIDQNGAQELLQKIKDVVLIWVTPPSMEELEKRLRGRRSETEEQIAGRLKIAQQELDFEEKNHIFHYWVVNDDLETAVQEVAVIMKKEILH